MHIQSWVKYEALLFARYICNRLQINGDSRTYTCCNVSHHRHYRPYKSTGLWAYVNVHPKYDLSCATNSPLHAVVPFIISFAAVNCQIRRKSAGHVSQEENLGSMMQYFNTICCIYYALCAFFVWESCFAAAKIPKHSSSQGSWSTFHVPSSYK